MRFFSVFARAMKVRILSTTLVILTKVFDFRMLKSDGVLFGIWEGAHLKGAETLREFLVGVFLLRLGFKYYE
jgi:hypothetical protein